jgi:hypothetical protein
MLPLKRPRFTLDKMTDSLGPCDCCGQISRQVAGLITDEGSAAAAYLVHWVPGHLRDQGAHIDIVFGRWGEGTTPADRYAVAMLHRRQGDGQSGLMVIDAEGRPSTHGKLASNALRRADVIGTPLAGLVFALVDAIYEQDDRLFKPVAAASAA